VTEVFGSNEMTLSGPLDGKWSPERPCHDYKLRTYSSPTPTPNSPERGEGLEMELRIDHVYMEKAPTKS